MASATAPSAVATAFLHATSSIRMKSWQGMERRSQRSLTAEGIFPPKSIWVFFRQAVKVCISRPGRLFSEKMVLPSLVKGTGQRMIWESSMASLREKGEEGLS